MSLLFFGPSQKELPQTSSQPKQEIENRTIFNRAKLNDMVKTKRGMLGIGGDSALVLFFTDVTRSYITRSYITSFFKLSLKLSKSLEP